MYKKMLDGFEEEVENFGNFPSYYMGLVTADGGLNITMAHLPSSIRTAKLLLDALTQQHIENSSVKQLNHGLS